MTLPAHTAGRCWKPVPGAFPCTAHAAANAPAGAPGGEQNPHQTPRSLPTVSLPCLGESRFCKLCLTPLLPQTGGIIQTLQTRVPRARGTEPEPSPEVAPLGSQPPQHRCPASALPGAAAGSEPQGYPDCAELSGGSVSGEPARSLCRQHRGVPSAGNSCPSLPSAAR